MKHGALGSHRFLAPKSVALTVLVFSPFFFAFIFFPFDFFLFSLFSWSSVFFLFCLSFFPSSSCSQDTLSVIPSAQVPSGGIRARRLQQGDVVHRDHVP